MGANQIRTILMLSVALCLIAIAGLTPVSAAIQATTVTPTLTAVQTTVPATATKTAAAPAVTATVTSTVPVATATKTVTAPVATATKTVTVPAATATKTVPAATATITPTKVVTPTATATKVVTPTATPSRTPTKTPTVAARAPRAGSVSSLSTAFALQNMDPSTTANISATFFDVTGTAVSTITNTAQPNRSVIVDQRSSGGGLDAYSTFQGSVVVSSTTQLAAVVNEFAGNAASLGTDFRADAYNGWPSTSAATDVILPQLLKALYDPATNTTYNSTIAIQNTSASSSASVTITYKQSTGTTYTHAGISLPPGTSSIVNLASDSVLSGVSVFYGTGTISSTQPVAVTIHHNAAGFLSIYSGFTNTDAATTLYMPQLLRNLNDPGTGLTWGSGVLVMSADGTSANVTMTYYNYNGAVIAESATANPMATFDQRTTTALAGQSLLYGSGVLTANKPIIAIVTYVCNYNVSRGLQGATYRAFSSSGAGTTSFIPLLQKNSLDTGTGVQWGTGVLGRLLGGSATTITITYYHSNGSTYTRNASVTPTSPMFTFDQRSDAGLPDGTMSAVITSSPAQAFSVIVNVAAPSSVLGDALMTFAGISQ